MRDYKKIGEKISKTLTGRELSDAHRESIRIARNKYVASRELKYNMDMFSPKICVVCGDSFLPKKLISCYIQHFLKKQRCCSRRCVLKDPERNRKVSEAVSRSFMEHPERKKYVSYKRSIETRRKMSEAQKGEKNWQFRGGNLHDVNKAIRKSLDYRLWREAVFARDNWTCQDCGERGGKLNADHIKPFSLFPELRFAIDNGRTLCFPCHRKTPTWGLHYAGLQALFSQS